MKYAEDKTMDRAPAGEPFGSESQSDMHEWYMDELTPMEDKKDSQP